jgi:hypothetical protein
MAKMKRTRQDGVKRQSNENYESVKISGRRQQDLGVSK